jgi:hydrogenase nickel incorporation protein HypA/HybF
MHELSIALSIVEGASEEAHARELGKIAAVHLKLGVLSGVVKDALLFSYKAACQDSELEGSRLVIEEVPVTVFCPACQCEREPIAPNDLRCSVCGEISQEILQGKELQVVGLEVVTAGVITAA